MYTSSYSFQHPRVKYGGYKEDEVSAESNPHSNSNSLQ